MRIPKSNLCGRHAEAKPVPRASPGVNIQSRRARKHGDEPAHAAQFLACHVSKLRADRLQFQPKCLRENQSTSCLASEAKELPSGQAFVVPGWPACDQEFASARPPSHCQKVRQKRLLNATWPRAKHRVACIASAPGARNNFSFTVIKCLIFCFWLV